MFVNGNSSGAPSKNVGYSNTPTINSGKFKAAILSLFAKIDDITDQLTDDSRSNMVIDGMDLGDKTGLAASFAIPKALNNYENQAALIMQLLQKTADLDKTASQIARG